MAWQAPKTDWIKGDYFNLNPDYMRIKGNAEYLAALIQETHPSFTPTQLLNYSVSDIPDMAFFNNIVVAVKRMIQVITPSYEGYDIAGMGTYEDINGLGFCFENLNAIENNMKLLYKALTSN